MSQQPIKNTLRYLKEEGSMNKTKVELSREWKRRVLQNIAHELRCQADLHRGAAERTDYNLIPMPRPHEHIDDYHKRVAGLKPRNTEADGWDQGMVEEFIREVADWIELHP